MPSGKRLRVYVDSCVLLAYIGNEEHRADTVQSVLEDARSGKIDLLTSVLSITEVAYVATEIMDPAANEDRIDQLWTPASPITVIDVSQRVARAARSVIRRARREGFRGVRSADAIHLGAADLQGCSRFFTYEKETTREQWSGLIEATVSEPYTDNPRFDFR